MDVFVLSKFRLFIDLPLYKELEINADVESSFATPGTIDLFCVDCGSYSPFKRIIYSGDTQHHLHILPASKVSEKEIDLQCQRDQSHYYNFYFKVNNGLLMKIGQYPSFADLEVHKISKYKSLLKKDYRDFSKAIGLFSHGIGSGSFVYLRRIFENLIEESKELALQEDTLDIDKYNQSRMDGKILILKDYLPTILVENRQVYSILSKGIHELSEDECLDLFPTVELAIELILDEKLAVKEKQNKVRQLKQFISFTVDKLK